MHKEVLKTPNNVNDFKGLHHDNFLGKPMIRAISAAVVPMTTTVPHVRTS